MKTLLQRGNWFNISFQGSAPTQTKICRKEGGKCVLFSCCFMFDVQLWGLVYTPVFKASMNNGKSGRLWYDSEEGKGRAQPTPSRFDALIVEQVLGRGRGTI